MKKILLALALLAVSSLVQAAVQLKEGHPESYTVVRGDTLWDIAGRFLNKPWQWRELWEANPHINNPDLIYPGDVLFLKYANGQPYLDVTRATSRGTVKLSPRIRTKPIAEAIPSIPLGKIQSFLLNNRIINSHEEFSKAPYMLSTAGDRIISGTGDRIYARGHFPKGFTQFGIFRQGKAYADSKGHLLGINADYIGSAKLVKVDGDIATLPLTTTTQEVRPGDRLFTSEDRPIQTFFQLSTPRQDIKGRIIDVPQGVMEVGRMNVVTINKGTRDGLEESNVLAAYKAGGLVMDPVTNKRVKVPDERAGLLLVFRAYDRISYGFILTSDHALKIGDSVRNP